MSKKTIFQKSQGEAFYPPRDSLGYVYLTSLGGEEGWEAKFTADWAKNLVASKVNSFSSDFIMGKAFSSLNSLIYKEIAAEQAFLSKYLKIDLETVKSYGFGQLIQSFNKILGYESSFNTYIQNIKNMAAEGKDGKVSRFYKLVNEDFPKALTDTVQKIIGSGYESFKAFLDGKLDDQIKEQTAAALTNKLKSIYGHKKNMEAEPELAALLQSLESSDALIQQLLQNYGATPEQLRMKAEEKGIKELANFKASKILLHRRGGNAFEILENRILNSISVQGNKIVLHTGAANNMKADHIITFGLSESAEELAQSISGSGKIDGSVRLKNIQTIENFLTNIKQANSEVVFISDKNYNLKTESFAQNKGFAAETPTLQNLAGVLRRANIDNIEDLVFALANTGDRRYNKDASNMEAFIATKIANFLFDDIVITDQLDDNLSSPSRIHVFDLGGVYIPLSVFLEGVYFSLQGIEGQFDDYVKVKYHATNIPYAEQTDGLTESDWQTLYGHVISKSTISIHFFGNFIEFISANF